jgi:hypothetical protein
MKIIDKRGKINFNPWMKMVKGCNVVMVLADGAARVLGAMHTLFKHTPLHE